MGSGRCPAASRSQVRMRQSACPAAGVRRLFEQPRGAMQRAAPGLRAASQSNKVFGEDSRAYISAAGLGLKGHRR